ncbi:methyltransferase-like protein 4 [Diachasma alloeum]|uniref:methyltransferase-like protein 4 n=1 Tax=Diachasma alloeum TaxID=454923 RepID=UPI00073839AD|nr:methyltransferase-like protein 4 [Diachasma alloeum]XP_015109134.1 methyltransferase-like protein 4 [Diachasma alloeum]
MSLLLTTETGWIISHLKYIKTIYRDIKNKNQQDQEFELNFYNKLFDINCQYLRDNQFEKAINGVIKDNNDDDDKNKRKRKRKRKFEVDSSILKEIKFVKETFEGIMSENVREEFFPRTGGALGVADNNREAREGCNDFFQRSFREFNEFLGRNSRGEAVVESIEGVEYVFPENCEFYSHDVRNIEGVLEGREFDFVLMDPPWWNKFVRRKKERMSEAGYKMMYNDELLKIPIGKLLASNGVIGVWCSNAQSHHSDIIEKIFPSWGIKPIGTWYWVKVTQSGHPICNFRYESVKQPYELIIFGVKIGNDEVKIPDKRIVISVPSSVHSHKPPLTEVIKQFLPENPKCLEIFARYLLPHWTSYGLEVLKFQHQWLFK